MPVRVFCSAHPLNFAVLRPLLLAVALAGIDRAESAFGQSGQTISATAVFRDGSQYEVPQVSFTSWDSDEAKLGDRKVFNKQNPIRTVSFNRATVPLEGPCVFLANGDVLPCEVIDYEPAKNEGRTPAVLRVAPRSPIVVSGGELLSIRADRVVAIAFGRRLWDELPAGSVVYTDGRIVAAKEMQWNTTGLRLLTERGEEQAEFEQLAAVRLGNVDIAQALADDVAAAKSAGVAPLSRISTTSGAKFSSPRATSKTIPLIRYGGTHEQLLAKRLASLEKLPDARRREITMRWMEQGRRYESRRYKGEKVVETINPAWAFGTLAVQVEEIVQRSFFESGEIPLSLMTGKLLNHKSYLLTAAPWQADRNVLGGPLAAGALVAEHGIGMKSDAELAFDLPAGAKSFSTWVAIDKQAQGGGCVQMEIHFDTVTDKPAWSSGILLGTIAPKKVGPLDVSKAKKLILVVRSAHAGRPKGADPLDIRDLADWLWPTVDINRSVGDLHQQIASVLTGADDWQVKVEPASALQVSLEFNGRESRWEQGLIWAADGKIEFRRKLKITPTADVLELALAAASGSIQPGKTPFVSGTFNGREIKATVDDAPSEKNEPVTYAWWDLKSFRGQEIEVVLTIPAPNPLPSGEKKQIFWRGLSLGPAVAGLPNSGELPKVEIGLTSIKPSKLAGPGDRSPPTVDTLPNRKNHNPPLMYRGQAFTGGYGMLRESTVEVPLEGKFKRFVAIAGCSVETIGPLKVIVDGRVMWEIPLLRANEPARLVSFEIPKGAKKLTLETGAQGTYDGRASFANAGFLTK